MDLLIKRTYHKKGTNGILMVNDKPFCFTIELPDKNNAQQKSCIPEGKYLLKKRYNEDRGDHLLLTGVQGRDLILIHPANNALKELRGCIAPVSTLTGPGCGDSSRVPFEKLVKVVYAAMAKKEEVWLRIISEQISEAES